MIMVTRLNGKSFYINPDLVKFIEETPDTIITLTDGSRLVVAESAGRVIEGIVDYRAKIFTGLPIRIKENYEDTAAPALPEG